MSFLPAAKFVFNRGYLADWQVGVYDGWTLSDFSNPIICQIDFGGGIIQFLHFLVRANVWAHSTNAYTLDYVLERAWNTYSFVGGEYDFEGSAVWQNGGADCGNSIILHAGSPSKFFRTHAIQSPSPTWYLNPICPEILA